MNLSFLRKTADWVKRQKDQYPLSERIARKRFLAQNKASLPEKTQRDAELETRLRSEMSALPIELPERKSSAENKWIKFKNDIRKSALEADARTFLSWPSVLHNMHYTPSLKELEFVKSRPDWTAVEKALESKSSVLTPFFALPKANENAIRQAFHFEKFVAATGIDLGSIDQIFEFGGGYGSMSVLLHRLGFKGTYAIFDWPELSRLQKYYLSLEGLDASRIRFLNDVKEIPAAIQKGKRTLIIGMWSLSECSPELRDSIFKAVDPNLFLISYQKEFGGVDNREYFKKLQESRPDVQWKSESIDYIPSADNKYLFGVK